MKIFVTGHRGYIGTVLTRMLFEQNFDVVGCDIGYYPQGFVVNKTPSLISLLRSLDQSSLERSQFYSATNALWALVEATTQYQETKCDIGRET